MRTETIIRQTENDPESINEMNKLYSFWGWSVLSIQITDNKIVYDGDSHTTGSTTVFGDEYGATGFSSSTTVTERITEHTNYATITYQRDLDDSRVTQCAELEKKYDELGERSWMDFVDKDKEYIERLYQKANEKKRWPQEPDISYIKSIGLSILISFILAWIVTEITKPNETVQIILWVVLFIAIAYLFIRKNISKKEEWKKKEPEVKREKQEFEAEQAAAKEEFEALKYEGSKAFIAKRLEIINEAKAILGIN